MPEIETVDENKEAKEAQDQFSLGFAGDVVPPDKPEEEPEPKPEIEESSPPPAEPKEEPKVEPVAETPQFVQITKEQFDRLESAAAKTADIDARMSKVFGTVGDMQQIVKKLQASTPSGMPVELPADVVAEMEADFPELAGHLRTSLERVLKTIRGTGPAAAPTQTPGNAPETVIDPEVVQKSVNEIFTKHEMDALEESHPKWREIVGPVDSEGKHNPNNEFRKWLADQDPAYQHRINMTRTPSTIARALDKFLAAKAAPKPEPQPAPKVAARIDRIRAAIPPRGDGGQHPPAKTAEDEFMEGFRTG